MVSLFKPADLEPSKGRGLMFSSGTIHAKEILSRYVQGTACHVPSVTDFDTVVRLNSTYLELVDRMYYWRGFATLCASFAFSLMFIGSILWPLFEFFFLDGLPHAAWGG